MTMKRRVAGGAMALGATRVVTNLANLAGLVVLARLLTPEDFGVVAIGTTVLGIVVALTELSLGSALIQRREVEPAHVDSAWTMAMIRAAAIVAGFALAAWPLAMLYDDARLAPVFIVAGATGALAGLINPKVALATRDMRFRPTLTVQLVQKLAGLAIAAGLALWLRNYWAILIGNALGALVGVLLSYGLVRYRPRFTLARARDLVGFSGWLFLGQLSNVLNWRFDQLLIGLVLPKAQLGAYSMADNLSAIPSRETTTPVVQALFPGFATMQDDRPRLRKAYLTAQAAIGLVALPAGFGLALLADPIVRVALGDKWLMAVPLIAVISICYSVQTLTTGARPLAMARGETRLLFLRDLQGLALRVPCVTIGLFGWGLMGLVWGRALSAVIGLAITFRMVRQLVGVGVVEQVWSHRRTMLATAAMSGAVLALDAELLARAASPLARLVLLAPAGALAYVGTLALLWVVEGRRPGAETELLGLARGVLAKAGVRARA